MFNPIAPNQTSRNYSTLYIGDLEEQITEEMLYSVFIKFGPIFSLRVMKDFQTKKSRGFGFVSYYNLQDAKTAKLQANHIAILKRPIRITWKKQIKDMSAENNIFVKNISRNVTEKDFEQIFSQFGSVFSSKISYDENGVTRGYGYVQFEDKESTDKCLENKANLVLDGQQLTVVPFSLKGQRPELNSNNLYIKNLPKLSEQEIQNTLTQTCKRFGEVTSLFVKTDPNQGLPFAFICFKNNTEANNAYKEMQNIDPFNVGQNIYVNWAQKKSDRLKSLRTIHQNYKNEQNIFTRNLRQNLTKQQVEEAFEVFGEISSCLVKDPQNIKYNALMGFINYKSKESALACLMGASSSEKIKGLFINEKVYVNLHVPKSQHQNLERMRQRMMPQMDPMAMFRQFQMMMPGVFPMGAPQNFMNMNPAMMAQMSQMGAMNPMAQMSQMGANLHTTNRGGRNLPPRGFGGFPKQNFQGPQSVPKQQKPVVEKKKFADVSDIRQNLTEFLTLDQDKQRSFLGEILFPLVQDIIKNKNDVPRVTGMLVDFEVFELQDILEILESKQQLSERVKEAEELIEEERNIEGVKGNSQ